jgi:hypothetical protein
MTTSTKKQRFINIGGTLYRYIDATHPLGLIITEVVRQQSLAALGKLDRRIIADRGKGRPTQHLENLRAECCPVAFGAKGAGIPWIRVQTRTSQVMQPDEKGEMVVMRYVHGAATTRFIQNVDANLPTHGQPIELSPPTPGRTMERHAEMERERKARSGIEPWRKNKRGPIEVGYTFLRDGAYVVTRQLVYRTPKPAKKKA